MRLVVFASGSTGNCALIQGGGRNILLDAGISARRMTAGLAGEGLAPDVLDGIFITHEHADHIAGLRVFTKQHPLPLYASCRTAEALGRTQPELAGLLRPIEPERPLSLGCMTVTAFPTSHDAAQSVGYRVEADGTVLASATDTGRVTNAMLRYLAGADAVLIEANHDLVMLKNGPYPVSLKKRILSDQGHLSNAECTWLAAVLASQGTKSIVLGHLSKNNNLPGLARRTVARALEGTDTALYVAPEYGRLALDVTAGAEAAPCCV